MWDTRCCATAGETREVMGRGHPDKHITVTQRHHTLQEQGTADADDVEEAQPMEDDIEVEDGEKQDREEEVRPRTLKAELDPKPAIQGILGDRPGKRSRQDVAQCGSLGSEFPSPEDSRDGTYAVESRSTPHLVQGRSSMEDDLDGAGRLTRARSAQLLCDELGGGGRQRR